MQGGRVKPLAHNGEVHLNELLLVPIAFLTSTLAAVMGMGGGILLITLMPGLVPPAGIIPLHAATQLASNASRAVFGWRHIDLAIIPAFILGALLSAWLGTGIYRSLDLNWLPAVIGVLILVITWVPMPTVRGDGQLPVALLGFYQTGLGMIVGATGPLGAAVLMRRDTARDWLVVNTGVYMTLSHAIRVGAFLLMGFSFAQWWVLLGGMIAASILGSYIGTRLRRRLPQYNFQRLFRWMITLLALRMVGLPLVNYLH